MSGQIDDETLQNFIFKKAPKRERKGNKGQRSKSNQAKSPTKLGHKDEKEPLRTEPSTCHMKQIN
jgi:hypothetical protein